MWLKDTNVLLLLADKRYYLACFWIWQ